MNENDSVSPLARRSFLMHVGAGTTILGASIAATGTPDAGEKYYIFFFFFFFF